MKYIKEIYICKKCNKEKIIETDFAVEVKCDCGGKLEKKG